MHGIVSQGFVDGDFVRSHPRVRPRAYYAVGLACVFFLCRVCNLQAAAEVEFRSFVVCSQKTGHVGDAYLPVGTHAQRQFVHLGREPCGRGQLLHDVQLTYAVVLRLVHIVHAAVCLPEGERALAVPEAHLPGHFAHIVRVHEILLVLEVDDSDTADVCRNGYMVIRYALCRPYASDPVRTFALDFEYPDLPGVGDGETFSGIPVAIFLYQTAHQAYGFPGAAAALEGYSLEFLYHEHPFLVLHLLAAGVGGFAHGQLVFVQARVGRVEETVGVGCLGYASALCDSVH